MCFAMFGCCGPPPFATRKAYNNTTPFALDWFDNRDGTGVGGSGGIRETAIIDWNDETGYTTGVLSCGDGSEVTGSTNEKAVIESDADDGGRQAESVSTPRTATLTGNAHALLKTTAVSGPFGGAWFANRSSLNSQFAFFDLDVIQQSSYNIAKPSVFSFNNEMDYGTSPNNELIIGYGRQTSSSFYSKVASKITATGSSTTDLSISVLATSGITGYATWVPRADSLAEFVICYNKSGSRNVAVIDKAGFTLSRTGSVTGTNFEVFNGTTPVTGLFRNDKVTATHLLTHLNNGTAGRYQRGTLSCWELTTPSEAWTKADKVRVVVAVDASNVYTVNPTTGELSAVALSGGAEVWTLDLSDESKLGIANADPSGVVLSSGNIAVWKNAGVTIVTTAGVEVATVDVGPCYGIVEKSNRWLIVGAKRTTSS